MIGTAFAVTTAYNRLKVPTSTIQILVFSVVGAALASGIGVHWSTILHLATVWVAAPARRPRPRRRVHPWPRPPAVGDRIGIALVTVGAVAAFAMGANDVSNASGALVGTGTFSPLAAGAVCGAGSRSASSPGASRCCAASPSRSSRSTARWRPRRSSCKRRSSSRAVAFGFFTSMNQALVAAMAGAGFARGREAVHIQTLVGSCKDGCSAPRGASRSPTSANGSRRRSRAESSGTPYYTAGDSHWAVDAR